MVAIAASKVKQFIKNPDKKNRAILIFGPDIGMVKENTSKLASFFSTSQSPEGDIITIDDSDLTNDPDRLSIEVNTISMFGGEKIIKFRPGSRTNPKILDEFLENKSLPAYLLVESGDLKKPRNSGKYLKNRKMLSQYHAILTMPVPSQSS